MKGLNLSSLKKIASDKHSSTFKHPDGHTIKVAHAKLSPKMRGDLEQIPLCNGGKVQRMADGGDVQQSDDRPSDDSSNSSSDNSSSPIPGVNININSQPNQTPVQQQQGGASGSWGDQSQQQQQAIPAQAPRPASSPDQMAVDPQSQIQNAQAAEQAAQPQAQAPQPSGLQDLESAGPAQQGQATPAVDMKDIPQETAAWAQDLANGHIKPETYSDLFAKKSTLGKVGTLFGLLVSGAGSGLTHQPNAVLEMMNKEISNDLDAQKNSKSNAQNYLRLNMENQLNQAKVSQLSKQGSLTNSQVKSLNAETQIKSFTLAKAQMLQSTFHNLSSNVDRMPEGPQKEAAKQQLGIIYSKIGDQISNLTDQAVGAQSYYNTLFGNQPDGSDEQSFQKNMAGKRMMGPQGEERAKDLESKHLPGIKGQASVPLSGEDRSSINSGIDFDQKLHRFMNWTQGHSGDLNPKDKSEGQALAAELQGAYRQATHGGVYKEGEQNFISKLIDSDPTKFFNSIRVMPQLKAIASENKARVNQLVKSKGLPGYEGSSEPQYKTVNGVKYTRGPNGEAIKVK